MRVRSVLAMVALALDDGERMVESRRIRSRLESRASTTSSRRQLFLVYTF